jgi:hypothetical protein
MCTAPISDVYGEVINNRTALSCFSCAVLATCGEREDFGMALGRRYGGFFVVIY